MKKIFLFALLFVGSQTVYSQVTDVKTAEAQLYKSKLSQTDKTLIIDISEYSMNLVGEFKDEIIGWKEKVVSVDINETEHKITVVHNNLIHSKEIVDVLNKYNIKKSKIISYQ